MAEYELAVIPITAAQAELADDVLREALKLPVKNKRVETVRREFAIVGLYDTATRRKQQARNLKNRLKSLMDEEGNYETARERWVGQSEINAIKHEYDASELNEPEKTMVARWKMREAKIRKRKINISNEAKRHPYCK